MPRRRGGTAMLPVMHPARPRPPIRRTRTGLSVVEVLVALVIVSVGLLGMAGMSALSLRTAASTHRERQAVRRLELRLATLAAAGCAGASEGAAGDAGDGVRERWTVVAAARGAAMLDATAEWRDGARMRSLVLRNAALC
jgi:Tfp pilus assembly protein PilV